MANPKSGSNATSNNYNLVKNNKNTIESSSVRMNVLKQAKLDLLNSMDFEKTFVNRNELASLISKNRSDNGNAHINIGIPGGNILYDKNPNITINIDLDSYGMKGEYENLINEINDFRTKGKDDNSEEIKSREKRLRELDTILAERCILDNGGSIEFKSTDEFESKRNAKDESREAFNELIKLDEYKGKIELISKRKGKVDYYVIKWTEKQIEQIRKKYLELLKHEEDDKKEKDEKNHEGNDKDTDEKKGGEINNKESEGENGKDNELEKMKKENERIKELIKKLTEDGEEKDRRITELENLVKEGGKNNKTEDKDTNEENTNDKENDIDDGNETDDKQNTIEESETLDENPNYISRSFVEGLIFGIRGTEGYPKGTIKIKEEVINIEEFAFYEEFKQEYIEAKGDAEKLSRLDKEFAEMIILFSPKEADYENRYCIKLSEAELKNGLYVSEERLARYGITIKVSEYFEKVVEREVIRERTIVRKLETVITELQTSIVELTRSITIEKSSSTIILEEIRKKRKLLLALIKRQKILLASLKGLNNDEELKKLREEEARLQKEYDELLQEKKKQNKLKKEIDAIKKKIAELEGSDDKSKLKDTINGKKKEADEIRDEIKNLEKERDSYKWRSENGTITADEIVTLKSNIEKLDKQIESLKSDLKKLEDEIKELESQLEGDDEIAKLEKEIADKKTERAKLQERLWELTAEDSLQRNETYHDIEARDAEIEQIEKNLKAKDEEIKKLEARKEELEKGEKDSEELKRLREKLAELEGQLDPDIDKKLKAKKKELDDIQKQIEDKEKNKNRSELEIQLIAIIEEQEALLVELEELESLLIVAKTEEEKIKIEEKIRIINKRLTIISQKITEFESFIQIYKSKVTVKKYNIYHVIPFNPIPNKPFEMTSVISDMGTDVFKEKAALKIEEELKRQYDGLGRWQIGSRLALFLGRGSRRKRMMRNEMNNMANTAFQTGAGYTTLNDQSQNAADRHAHELLTGMAAVNRITTVHNPQIDQLCKDYLNNVINDSVFQQKFNAIVAADANIQNILQGQNITHIGTNILLQLKERKALNTLINALDSQLGSYITTGNQVHMNNMQNYVEQYIKDYQKLPAFKTTFEQFLKGDLNARNQLRRYLAHEKAIMNMQITNLKMNIDIINKGKSAYKIDNKDREKGWKYRLGHKLDKHPRGTAIGSVALAVGLGVATAPLSAVAGAAVTTGVFGSYVGFTNYIKKRTHHTKEQNTHEKNVVTDYRNEQAKIQNRQNLALNGRGLKKYKAKRQLALYDQTTQENIQLSNQIAEYITNLSAKSGPLTANEDNFMKLNLIEGWARLKYYRAMGHNFLASENVDRTEKDMRSLEKAITLGLQKIGQTTNNIETTMTATNGLGTNITYNVIQNDLKASYDKSMIQFKRERRNLALKYGISTAALSIGTALGMQYITGTGVFAGRGTPATPASTTSHNGGTDNFRLGKDEISLPGEIGYTSNPTGIHDATLSAVNGAPNGSTVTFTYGVGTDATPVMAGRLTSADLGAKISSVQSSINGMSGLTSTQKASFLSELSKLSHSGFTNDNLASMRAAEYLQHCAQAMSDCGNGTLIPAFSKTLDVSGGTYNNLAERFMTGAIDITTPGKPGTNPVKRGRWIMGVPLFFNTFKKRKASNDTTDQNFGTNNQNNNQNNNRRSNP